MFTFLLSKARQTKWKLKVKKIMQQEYKKTKNEVTKICNEPGSKQEERVAEKIGV